MKIKVQDVYNIAEHIRQNAPFNKPMRDNQSFTFACPQDLESGELKYEEIEVYFDYKHGWVMEFKNPNSKA